MYGHVRRGHDHLGRNDAVVRDGLSIPFDELNNLREGTMETRLVVGLDGIGDLAIELFQPMDSGIVELVLPLSADSHNHLSPSSCF